MELGGSLKTSSKALKMTTASGQNVGESCFPLSWSLENPLGPSFWSQLRIAAFNNNITFWYPLGVCSTCVLMYIIPHVRY